MTYQSYGILAIILLALCGLLLLVTVLIFFKFSIIDVIGDLSGRTAKKQIEQFREGNVNSGKKRYRPSPVNLVRGKTTEPMSKKLMKSRTDDFQVNPSAQSATPAKPSRILGKRSRKTKDIPTDILDTNVYELPQTELLYSVKDDMPQTELLNDMPQTELLSDMPQTELLVGNATTDVLTDTEMENLSKTEELERTEVLAENAGTEILKETDVLSSQDVKFTVVRSIKWIHTDEVI